MKKPLAIVCSDLHLRDTVPLNRRDDYWIAQETKLGYILSLDAPYIFCGGDLLDKWNCSPRVLSLASRIGRSGHKFITTIGQHEMPYHNLGKMNLSGLQTLHETKTLCPCCNELNTYKINWGEKIYAPSYTDYVLIHIYVNHSQSFWADDSTMYSKSPLELFEALPKAKLIVTGDNHIPFTMYHNDQLLLNSGSMMRMTIAQKEHKPRVYLYYDNNTFDTVYLPIKQNVFYDNDNDKHISDDSELREYIEFQKNNSQQNVSFEDNLKQYMRDNKLSESVIKMIHSITGE